jgi:hypothetical protein
MAYSTFLKNQFFEESRKVSLATGNQGQPRYLEYCSFTVLLFQPDCTHLQNPLASGAKLLRQFKCLLAGFISPTKLHSRMRFFGPW